MVNSTYFSIQLQVVCQMNMDLHDVNMEMAEVPIANVLIKWVWFILRLPTCTGLLHTNGFNASIVTIQGEMDVPRFLAKKGPKGTYSHF